MDDRALREAFAPSSSIKFDADYIYHVVQRDELEGATGDHWEVVALTDGFLRALVRRTRKADEADTTNGRLLKEADAVNVRLTKESRDQRLQLKSRGRLIADYEDDAHRHQGELRAMKETRDRLFRSLETVENDVAKVRSEIGEARWREIIGTKSDEAGAPS